MKNLPLPPFDSTMRAAFFTGFILTVAFSFAQNYVAGGVLAYHGNAYERCIGDLNKALANQSGMSTDIRAKAYFYRGMAKAKIYSQSPGATILGEDPVASTLNDLARARTLDAQWASRSDAELNSMLRELRAGVEREYNRAQTLAPKEGRPIYSRSIDRLQIYLDVRNDYPARLLLAKLYEAYGDVYFYMAEDGDPIQVQRQYLSHYSRAIIHYEEALRIQGQGTKELLVSLETLSSRIGDKEREARYKNMASQLDDQ